MLWPLGETVAALAGSLSLAERELCEPRGRGAEGAAAECVLRAGEERLGLLSFGALRGRFAFAAAEAARACGTAAGLPPEPSSALPCAGEPRTDRAVRSAGLRPSLGATACRAPLARVPQADKHYVGMQSADMEAMRPLGEGTSGVVQLVRHRPTDQLMALKVRARHARPRARAALALTCGRTPRCAHTGAVPLARR
jgi:hypothetical protein